MTPEKIHAKVLRLFTWAPDQETFDRFEYWSSFADDVEQGKPFTGDCDNFALTCAELLVREGYDKEDVRLVTCWVETGGYHIVCTHKGYVLDNRQRNIMHWGQMPYKWDKAMVLSEPGVWRKVS